MPLDRLITSVSDLVAGVPAAGDVPVYDGAQWVPDPAAAAIPGGDPGEVLRVVGTSGAWGTADAVYATDYGAKTGASIQAAIDACAAAGGGTVDLAPGTWAVTQTIVLKEGVHLRGRRAVDKSNPAAAPGAWLCWTAATAGTVLQIGHRDQTVSVRNAGLDRIGIDGGNRADVIGVSLGSNTRTSAAYVTTAIQIQRFVISRCGIGLRWGTGETQEQVDGVAIALGEVNSVVDGHPQGSCAIRVNGTNCGDFSVVQEVRTVLGSSLADGAAAIDLVFCGALTLDNCFGGGEGRASRDWIRVTYHNGLVLSRCQCEKYRAFLRVVASFSNDNVCVELRDCYVDDPAIVEGNSRVASYASQIKSGIYLSGAAALWDGYGDTLVVASGGFVQASGVGAGFRNTRTKRASIYGTYAAGERLLTPLTGAAVFEKEADVVVRGGRKAPTWTANTDYGATLVERSWRPSTAYGTVGTPITPTIGNGYRYRLTVAGTSGTVEPLFNRAATAAVYVDGTCTWVYDAPTTAVSSTTYAEPVTPNGHVYKKVAVTGTRKSGAVEPTWPTGAGDEVVDNEVTWQETGTSALVRPQVVLFGDRGSAPPASGWFERGHLRWNDGPDAGEQVAFLCVLSGNPGTWLPLGRVPRARIVTSGPVTMTDADRTLLCRITAPLAVTLPSTAYDGETVTVADDNGTAAAQNITVSPASGNVNGAASYAITTNYGFATFLRGDGRWTVVAKG